MLYISPAGLLYASEMEDRLLRLMLHLQWCELDNGKAEIKIPSIPSEWLQERKKNSMLLR